MVFIDIVAYSKRPLTGQLEVKQHLTSLIRHGLKGAHGEDVVILDSGDGAAICFLADPVEALYFAINLHSSMLSKPEDAPDYACRIGINLGPVKVIKDVNGRRNTVGDGINNAQRVMDFAEPNQLLVSRSFHDVVACLSEEYSQLFAYLGVRHDKHVKEYDIYEIVSSSGEMVFRRDDESDDDGFLAPPEEPPEQAPEQAPAASPVTARQPTAAVPATTEPALSHQWDPADLKRISKQLAAHIGPLAKVLVKRAAKRACSPEELYKLLAEHLPDDSLRSLFLQGAGATTAVSAATPTAIATAPTAIPADTSGVPLPNAVREQLRHRLAESQGPLAKVLIKRAMASAAHYPQLCEMLAAELPEAERPAFIAYARRLLPEPG